ncbi:hypothetical protein G8E10_24885 [Rhizobiaceae bacterium CRRU44]|uniref:Uncharacterized protein n=1 Tax=Ferranicluibacter rubi TaxID=2715133 RepID=A0AA43ZJ92_9HYPH|nr:hypothetical protein [Ferranicluibacter rubi]NHT78939.1 hypothetical protein [Ferranicluibacter rubi]
MTKPTLCRRQIADQISDLRQMRGALNDLISAACGLMSQAQAAQVPDLVRLELLAALSHAENADQIAQGLMRQLYDTPTPRAANANEAAA